MQNVSERFLIACQESSTRLSVVDLYFNRSSVPVITDLPVVSGTITIDSTAAQRTSGTLTLSSTDLIAITNTATLEPYGVEVGVRCGVMYADGTLEFVQMGVFLITDITYNEEEGDNPTITFTDRSQWIAEQSSKTGIEDYSTKSTFFAIQDLMTKSVFVNVSSVSDRIDPGGVAPNTLALVIDHEHLDDIVIPGGSPMDGGSFWDDIQILATSLGAEIFFSEDGVNVILQKAPDITYQTAADADVVVDVGVRGTLITSATGLSRQGAYNAVQMTGALPANAASTATPPTVFVCDTDPASLTYYDQTGGTQGPFGRVVLQTSSDTIVGIPALTAAATALLKKGLGLTKTLGFTMLPNPAMQVGDVVAVNHLNGTTDVAMITSLSMDLGGGAMSVGTKCPNQITPIDTGTGVPSGGGGGSIPVPPAGATTKTYPCIWSQSYNSGLHAVNLGSHTFAYQGWTSGGGVVFSQLGFDYARIQTDLSGKILVSMTLTLYYKHWWFKSGGTSWVGTTNNLVTAPNPYVAGDIVGGRVVTANWPNPGQKTINLGLTIATEFQDGVSTGIILGSPGVPHNVKYYGYASGFGAVHPPVLKVTYE